MGDFNDPFMRNKDAAVQARTKAQNRANVLQLKLMGQSHPTGLTPNLLKLFEPRPPLEYKPPPEKRTCPSYTGMAQFVSHFAEPGEPEYAPPVQEGETKAQKKARIHKLQLEKGAAKAAEDLEKYDPTKDPNISGDPYKTLFVAKLSYETTEHRLKREFEAYGPIKRVRLITDKETNKPRGYAFIEYVHTRDMKTAYKQADGRKVDLKRVLVDVERGRTVPNWRPRRLGGGLGSTRVGGEELNQKHSGREQQQIASGGPPRSEEPRVREDRRHERPRERSRERGRDVVVREREKSREREREKPREREREKSRELSHDRMRDRDPREDRQHRHHRDRDRNREGERERGHDRDRVDRVRSRDRERDRGREHDRDHPRERRRERERDYPDGRDVEYDQLEPARHRERSPVRQNLYDEPIKQGLEHDYDHYDHVQPQGQEQLKRNEPEYYDPDAREEGEAIEEYDNDYHRSERSLSREYKG